MISLTVTPDATLNKMSVLENAKRVSYADRVGVGGVPNGTEAGRPAVMIALGSVDGSVVIGETSLALLLSTADALKAKYGDPRA